MALKKQELFPDEYVVKQGDDGKTAFLIVSGASVEIDGKTIGKMKPVKFLVNYL